jgi:hypothetical protein
VRNHRKYAKLSEQEGIMHIAVIYKSVPVVIRNGISIIHVHRLCGGGCEFLTQDGEKHKIDGPWDLLIAHPPCTYLTVSGNRWFNMENYYTKASARWIDRVDGIRFFMDFVICNAKKIAIENPIGIMSNVYRKPDQIIQPYEYGHPTRKSTCLWLKGLPLLKPTNIVKPEIIEYKCKNGKVARFGKGIGQAMDDNGKKYAFDDPMTAILRSKTFPGIAKAMAEQWG